jgi:uroporphyrinogen-III decarboxylase
MTRIPTEFVFSPNWWFQDYGITFDRSFYLDRRRRVENDVLMRRALFDRFGIGDRDLAPRPILGSMHVAGGFVIPALFGAEIRFSENQAPFAQPLELSAGEIMRLKVPDLNVTWPMRELLADAEVLARDYGTVEGDINTDGVLNIALCLRGQQLFLDFYDSPELVDHLFAVISDTVAQVASTVRSLTGTASVSVNRSILNIDPTIFLHSNCSLQMISPDFYRKHLFACDVYLSERLEPYGIHHCGSNFHLFADSYRQLGAVFFDVGWGSDIRSARRALAEAFLNLRLSPVRMLRETPASIRADLRDMLEANGQTERTGICCINMDHGTPDENIRAVLDFRPQFRFAQRLGQRLQPYLKRRLVAVAAEEDREP